MNLVVITGSSKGLGAALLEVYGADAENFVVGMARTAPTAAVDSAAERPVFVAVDMRDATAVERAFATLATLLAGRKFARATLFNNAGIVEPVARFDGLNAQALAHHMSVNLVAPMLATCLFAEVTKSSAEKRLVVNISSGAAKRPIAGWSAYCAAKAGLEMATRVAALEQTSDSGLSVCALAPGVVDTPMQAVIRAQSDEAFPDVQRFRNMKAEGVLRDATAVAQDIKRLAASGRLVNGGLFDLRELLQSGAA